MILLRNKKERFLAMFHFMPAMFLFYFPFAVMVRSAYIHVVNTLVENGKMPVPPLWLWIMGLACALFFVPLFFLAFVCALVRIYKKYCCRCHKSNKF